MMRVYVFAFCAMMAAAVSATEIRDAAAALARLGFEDIRISQRDNTLYASVEPTAYRGTFRGAGVAVEELGRLFPSASDIELAITEYQSPQVAVHARRDDSGWNAQVDYETDAVLSALTQTAAIQKSTGRIDVRFYPMVSLDNHRFDKLYEYIVSIAPAVETTLWKGSRLTLQPVFPIATNVWHEKADAYIHLGVAALQQELRFTERLRAILSGGIFVGNVAGLDANLSYRLNKSLTLGMQAALLGDAYASGSGYHFDKLGEVTFLGKASYYHSPTRIEAGLTGGRFIYGDYGARLDLTRHFGEYAIGVFGILTGGEHNAGFHFAIPMGGKCQPRRGAMRMMLPEYFDWEYNMVSYYEYADERMGYQNETRPDVNHSAHYWQASYVELYLRKYLEGSIK
jgi:hypothetical protein